MKSLTEDNSFQCRVSSVLNKDVKNYGKHHMFDGKEETCWNSEAGSPQWILLTFEREVDLKAIDIEFQGGFVGKQFFLEAGPDTKNLEVIQELYPEDINSMQQFNLDQSIRAKSFRLIFYKSTDLFGRIIIYKLLFH